MGHDDAESNTRDDTIGRASGDRHRPTHWMELTPTLLLTYRPDETPRIFGSPAQTHVRVDAKPDARAALHCSAGASCTEHAAEQRRLGLATDIANEYARALESACALYGTSSAKNPLPDDEETYKSGFDKFYARLATGLHGVLPPDVVLRRAELTFATELRGDEYADEEEAAAMWEETLRQVEHQVLPDFVARIRAIVSHHESTRPTTAIDPTEVEGDEAPDSEDDDDGMGRQMAAWLRTDQQAWHSG